MDYCDETSLIEGVCAYVLRITNYNDWGGNPHKKCPFNTFEEATQAYLLHEERIKGRDYLTESQLAWNRLFTYAQEKGIYWSKRKKLRKSRFK